MDGGGNLGQKYHDFVAALVNYLIDNFKSKCWLPESANNKDSGVPIVFPFGNNFYFGYSWKYGVKFWQRTTRTNLGGVCFALLLRGWFAADDLFALNGDCQTHSAAAADATPVLNLPRCHCHWGRGRRTFDVYVSVGASKRERHRSAVDVFGKELGNREELVRHRRSLLL
jgi:hypothetical protein